MPTHSNQRTHPAHPAHRAHPSEAWTVPLHVAIWATIIVGFIMALVVLLLH